MNPTISPARERTALTLLAIERLLTVKAAILAQPELYDQMKVGTPGEINPDDPDCDACGSPSCIFGWACHLFIPGVKPPYASRNIADWTFKEGAKLLCLDYDTCEHFSLQDTAAGRLYELERWPLEFRLRYAGSGISGARVAAERIDHFIATDGAE